MLVETTCSACGAATAHGARYCGSCGADLVTGRRLRGGRRVAIATFATLAVALTSLAVALVALHARRSPARAEVAAANAAAASTAARRAVVRLTRRVSALEAATAALRGRLRSTQTSVQNTEKGLTPLANRALRSVFTIEAGPELGSGFVAWVDSSGVYAITANHVISLAGSSFVDVTKNHQSWQGEVIVTDPANDLALIRLSGDPAGVVPLWQNPLRALPSTGDELLLVGSPYGLEGTVTTGIVSRVTGRVIQTDAAANPGNSGGPALDRNGRVVGVLVAGGGENLNFAVPIARACVRLRKCS